MKLFLGWLSGWWRGFLVLVLLGVVGCGDSLTERCNERGGVYAKVSAVDRSHDGGALSDEWRCFKPDTISLAIPRPTVQP